jgi:hypothetical protein
MANAAIAAVSNLSVVAPIDAALHPLSRSIVISAGSNPPSGPTAIDSPEIRHE